jgi:hypothetical protein
MAHIGQKLTFRCSRLERCIARSNELLLDLIVGDGQAHHVAHQTQGVHAVAVANRVWVGVQEQDSLNALPIPQR